MLVAENPWIFCRKNGDVEMFHVSETLSLETLLCLLHDH